MNGASREIVDSGDEDFDDEESFEDAEEESGVQLGMVVPCEGREKTLLFRDIDWHDWDGGKAGGWPIWLNPRDLPAPERMRCGECGYPMSFLVQHPGRSLLTISKPGVEVSCGSSSRVVTSAGDCYPSMSPSSANASLSGSAPGQPAGTSPTSESFSSGRSLASLWPWRSTELPSLAPPSLYCPLDHEEDAFHRCLYVFCCPKASCSKRSSVKALRCQLPRANAFYPYEPNDEDEGRTVSANQESLLRQKRLAGADPRAWGVTVCCVCGSLAKSTCSKCKRAKYCGREHQAEDWKQGGHKQACGSSRPLSEEYSPPVKGKLSCVFREFEVEVRPEPPPPPLAPDGRTADDTLASQLDLGKADIQDPTEDEDSKLSQAELDRIAGVHGVKDKVTLQFLSRTQANRQVIRYDAVGAGPLWSSSRDIPKEADVPPCPRCGRRRKFEFQVMPHLLHYLGVEANSKVIDPRQTAGGSTPAALSAGNCMDWGTLVVYTCPASCPTACPPGASRELSGNAKPVVASEEDEIVMNSGAVSYVEEFVWRQPPP